MKHSNVAIFVPHNGCPYKCSFCNQNTITGFQKQPSVQDVDDAVKTAVNSLKENTVNSEIAFFGGSFTAINRDYMITLLEAAYKYVAPGLFKGIRISTRPDCIDDEILKILKSYKVTSIELGAQSMNDEVLLANRRGHKSEDVINSSKLIKAYGFSLGLQMMTGLYKTTYEYDIETAKKIARLKPDTVRIYPTVVIENTELAYLYKSGKYNPFNLEKTVALCADILDIFNSENINVIRLGLHDSEDLKNGYIAGAYHPAMRELCEAELFYRKIICFSKEANQKVLNIKINPKNISKLVGQKKCNLIRLEKMGLIINIEQSEKINKKDLIINDIML